MIIEQQQICWCYGNWKWRICELLFIGERIISAPVILETTGLIVHMYMQLYLPCGIRGSRAMPNQIVSRRHSKSSPLLDDVHWSLPLFYFLPNLLVEILLHLNVLTSKGNLWVLLCRNMHYSSHLEQSRIAKGALVICPQGFAVLMCGWFTLFMKKMESKFTFKSQSVLVQTFHQYQGNALDQSLSNEEMRVNHLYRYIWLYHHIKPGFD